MQSGDQLPRIISATIGTDESIPPDERRAYLEQHVRTLVEYRRVIADTLLEKLLIEGAEQRIQLEDIERLISTEKTPAGQSPEFIRKIVIELMVCMRPKRF